MQGCAICFRLTKVSLALLLTVAGPSCVPKRVYWSPDGQQAVILADQQVYVSTAEGELSAGTEAEFQQVAWLPDSTRLVAVTQRSLTTWARVKELMPPEQAAELVELAGPFREQVLAHEGPWKDWRPQLSRPISAIELLALWTYIREREPEESRGKLGDDWNKFADVHLNAKQLQLCEVDTDIKPGRVLSESLYDIAPDSLRVSRDGRKVLYVLQNVYAAPNSDKPGLKELAQAGGALMLLSLDAGAEPILVERFAAWRNDFMPDGQSIVYATAKPIPQGESVVLGSIERRRVREHEGRFEIGEPEQLCGIVHLPDTKIVCLDDGQILFSTPPVTLPMATDDMPRGASLFGIQPDRRATIAPMLTRSAEASAPMSGFDHGTFDVRPDGAAVTLMGSREDGKVAVYHFATGQVEYVVSATEDWSLLERPAWRNNEELSLVVPPGHEWGSPGRIELVLYSLRTKLARCISRDWPDELMNTWQLRGDRSTTQPQ